MKPVWIILGLLSTAAGVAGIVLPLVPTTPFLLLAAFAFARSSPTLYSWLVTHPTLGGPIANWRDYGAINKRSKFAAIALMASALCGSAILRMSAPVIVVQVLAMTLASAFILSRPDGPRNDA